MNPNWYGFNVLWLFQAGRDPDNVNPGCVHIDLQDLDFMASMGCNFVRLPMDYRFFIHHFDYDHPDEEMLKVVDRCVEAIVSRGLHCSLNIHRGPGYCINGNELEKHNLWTDEIAQKAFANLWKMFAQRYATYTVDQLSFDLLNEPPSPGQYGLTHENHKAVMKAAVDAIRSVTPDRKVISDGLCGGHVAAPEMADLNVILSGRGYMPMRLTHWHAEWMKDSLEWEKPVWPGLKSDGMVWDRDGLLKFYDPWKELSDKGVPVHIGECGCYNKIDNKTALAFYSDWFDVMNELNFGYALWNFRGPFGIAEHRREGTRWEYRNGIMVDPELYDLFVGHMKKW